jgi:hypothetical protein
MQAIPAINTNKIAPPIQSFTTAPKKNPTMPTRIITIIETTVLNIFTYSSQNFDLSITSSYNMSQNVSMKSSIPSLKEKPGTG